MWRRILGLCLAFGLLSALCWPSPSPVPSSSSVSLSQAEYDQIEAAMESAKESLRRSNETIADQSRSLTRLWLLSGALAVAVVAESAALLVDALKK